MTNLFNKLAKNSIGPRENQVHSEDVEDPAPSDYQVARIVAQLHDAKRAGRHTDYRLILPGSNRAISFASRKGLPVASGEPRLLVQTPDHTIESATFSGILPPGYGEGPVRVVQDTKGIYKSVGNKLDLTIPKGDLKGRYTLIKQKGRNWLAIRHKPPQHYWEEYQSIPKGEDWMLDSPEFIAERKYDGHHVVATLDAKKGILLAARNKSVMGDIIPKEDHVPHLRDSAIPSELHGTVLRGELISPSHSFSQTSSTLLSNPVSSVEAQNKIGKLIFVPHDLVRGPKGLYAERLSLPEKKMWIDKIVQRIGNTHVQLPETEYENKRKFHEDIIRSGGEGTVVKHIPTGQSFKLKKSEDYDLKIVGFVPGEGKYLGKATGAFLLADRAGRLVGGVSSGITDKTRQDSFKSPKSYIHKVVRVSAHSLTPDGQLRHPTYLGLSDKSVADVIEFQKQANDANPNSQAITSGLDIDDKDTDPEIEYNRKKHKRYLLGKVLMQSKDTRK